LHWINKKCNNSKTAFKSAIFPKALTISNQMPSLSGSSNNGKTESDGEKCQQKLKQARYNKDKS